MQFTYPKWDYMWYSICSYIYIYIYQHYIYVCHLPFTYPIYYQISYLFCWVFVTHPGKNNGKSPWNAAVVDLLPRALVVQVKPAPLFWENGVKRCDFFSPDIMGESTILRFQWIVYYIYISLRENPPLKRGISNHQTLRLAFQGASSKHGIPAIPRI